MNTDIKNTVKQCATCMEYQQMQLHKKTIPYEMPYEPWVAVDVDIFTTKNNTLLFIVD